MRLAAYVQAMRTVGRVSGVGKHIGRAPPALTRLADVKLLCAHDQLDFDGRIAASSPLAHLPMAALPWSARRVEWGGTLFNRPTLDRWTGQCDWLYCPAETPVAARRARLAVTAHTSDWLETDLPWANEPRYIHQRLRWRLIFRAVRRRGARVLAVSAFLRDRLVATLGLDPRNVDIIGNGVEDEFYSSRAESVPAKIQSLQAYVLAVGGLTVYKGGDRVLDVANELKKKRSGIRVVIVGQHDAELRRRAESMDNVVLMEFVGINEGLPELYAGAFAAMVLSRYETFGIPVAEAMASGIPVLASRVGAIPEVVDSPDQLVDADNSAQIADHLHQLLIDDKKREQIGGKLRQSAERFRWDRIAQRIFAALAEN